MAKLIPFFSEARTGRARLILAAWLFTVHLAAGQTLEVFSSFQGTTRPFGLARGTNGLLYGVSQAGGADNGGTFFRVEANGTITTLASFTRVTGTVPVGLTLGRDGNFYGAVRLAASSNQGGSIFKATPAGALTHVASLGPGIGYDPRPNLVEGEDGVFYGTTGGLSFSLGPGDAGSVFKVNVASGTVTPLKLFSYATSALFDEGIKPADGLARGTNGSFYGTCELGGVSRKGTVFRITPAGVFTKLVDLGGVNGEGPLGTLAAANDGMLYGTAQGGGGSSRGTAFRITTAGAFTRLTNFFGPSFGTPLGTPALAPDGSLIGYGQIGNNAIAVFRLTTAGGLSLPATIPTAIIHTISFAEPSLVIGADGAAYGARPDGGVSGVGAIFRVPASGGWTNAASFVSETGFLPVGALASAADGHLYGVTYRGGPAGFGTVYRMTPTGAVSRVAHFTNAGADSFSGRLVPAAGGIFYGVTEEGGTNGHGSAFRASTNGTITTLASFGGAQGRFPRVPVFGPDGALYGVTSWGPAANDGGRVFRLTTNGVLSTFADLSSLGLGQATSLLLATDGVFYGGAESGVFRLTTNGVLSVVAPLAPGTSPSPLVQGGDGNLYTTTYGGGSGQGTVLRVTRDGQVLTILDLADAPGRNPVFGLTAGPDGLLHGVLDNDQSSDDAAVIFRVTLGGYLSTLHNFNTGAVRLSPVSALTFGSGGGLYGTAEDSVYRLTGLPALPAYAQTGPAESVAETTATLTGEVAAGGGPLSVFFDYGPTTNYGLTIASAPASASGASAVAVRANLAGLTPRTTYQYRVRAGGLLGANRSFRTGPRATTLEQALDAPGLVWLTGPASPWFVQSDVTFDGDAAAQSGPVDDDERSDLTATVTGPGTLSFRWKVSSEDEYDYLRFFTNGFTATEPITGEVDWRQVNVTLTNGTHILTWRYDKDESDSDGTDAGWVDTVTWTPAGRINITQFVPLAGVNPRYRLTWQAVAGRRYVIENSRDFGAWTSVPGTQRTATSALETIDLDPGTNAPPAGFFRVQQLP